MLKQTSSILCIKCAKSLGIGTGLGSSSFKTTDFFAVNPFMEMFIICELRTGNLRTTKLRTKMRMQSHWSIDGSHVIRTVRILVLKLIFRSAPSKTPGRSVNILHVSNVDENDIKSLVSTISLTYIRTEGGRRRQANGLGQS